MLPAKIVVKGKDKNLSDSIKIFDFEGKDEISQSFLENEDKKEPLPQPKFYLNILYHDKVAPPLNKEKEVASSTDDTTWHIIPISFSQNKERWSETGMKCIIIDAYVNTSVYKMFKSGAKKISSLTNYILQKFQQLVKDHYIIHKKTCKILKSKKYKAWRVKNDTVGEYVLPEALHADHYHKVIKRMKEMQEQMRASQG